MTMTISGSGTITGLSAGGLPDSTIVQADLATGVAGNGPAFSAYQSSAQTLSSVTITKIQFQTEEFDTNSNYDKDTNYRFLPTVAGYYQVNAAMNDTSTGTNHVILLYKNGTEIKRGNQISYSGSGQTQSVLSALVYCNGTTDYLEIYGYLQSGAALTAGAAFTYFQASMVRAA